MTRILVPAVKLWPDGAHQSGRGQPDRLDTAEEARAKLAAGECAVVAPGDVDAVRAWTRERGSSGALDG